MSPIVIQQSRLKLAILFVLFVVLTLVMAFMGLIASAMPDLWAYLGISLFAPLAIAGAVAAVASGMSLRTPGTITADETGVVYRNWRGERRFAWGDIAEFVVFAPESRFRSPGVQLKEGARKFVSFGRSWEMGAEEIVEALRAALAATAKP